MKPRLLSMFVLVVGTALFPIWSGVAQEPLPPDTVNQNFTTAIEGQTVCGCAAASYPLKFTLCGSSEVVELPASSGMVISTCYRISDAVFTGTTPRTLVSWSSATVITSPLAWPSLPMWEAATRLPNPSTSATLAGGR